MYNKNVAVTGRTIRETTSYDYFREDKIRMELYRYIYAIYNEGYRTFLCDMNTYIGLLAADSGIGQMSGHLSGRCHSSRQPSGKPSGRSG